MLSNLVLTAQAAAIDATTTIASLDPVIDGAQNTVIQVFLHYFPYIIGLGIFFYIGRKFLGMLHGR